MHVCIKIYVDFGFFMLCNTLYKTYLEFCHKNNMCNIHKYICFLPIYNDIGNFFLKNNMTFKFSCP